MLQLRVSKKLMAIIQTWGCVLLAVLCVAFSFTPLFTLKTIDNAKEIESSINDLLGDTGVDVEIPEEIDFSSVDVSFISLSLILPVMRTLLKDNGQAVCLIKPQFEAGKDKVGKKGVVRDKNIHLEVINKIFDVIINTGFAVLNLDYSPIKGPEGNIEYLIYLSKCEEGMGKESAYELADRTVERSHELL